MPRHDTPAERRKLVERVGVCVRTMGAQSAITSRAIADRFGLHTTDLEVLDLITLRQHTSPGELARVTGLTSGAVTALIDRLVDAGLVERHSDATDRRRVIVRARPGAIEPIKAVYLAIGKRNVALWSTYTSRELEVIADFLTRSTALQVEFVKNFAAKGAPVSTRRRRPARSNGRSGTRRT